MGSVPFHSLSQAIQGRALSEVQASRQGPSVAYQTLTTSQNFHTGPARLPHTRWQQLALIKQPVKASGFACAFYSPDSSTGHIRGLSCFNLLSRPLLRRITALVTSKHPFTPALAHLLCYPGVVAAAFPSSTCRPPHWSEV